MTHVPQSIDDGLWRWTARHPEWHPGEWGAEVASFAVRADGVTLLVDPLLPGSAADAETIAALDDIVAGDVAVIVSVPYHTRSAEPLADRYGATILGHPAVRKRLDGTDRFRAVGPGDEELPAGVRFHAIGRPRRHEMPIWIPGRKALVFGDALVEAGGELRVWHEPAKRDFVFGRLNPTIAPLVALGADRVLVTHGEPVLAGGAAELARALEREPFWHRE
jgi:glyoxylase-like metal-dependent hydrolase (beta-lactamase superfamily II)